MGQESGMGPGPIAGLCIGVILFAICLIILLLWFTRLRHYWVSRKHAKMPSPVSEGVIAPETQHQLYKSSNTNGNFPTSDPWQFVTSGYRVQQPGEVYPYAFSNQQLTSFDQGRSHFSAPDSSGPYAFGLGSHKLVKEPYVAATYRPQLSNIPRVQAAVPASSSQQPPLWSAYTLGDLSSVDSTGSTSHLYSGQRSAAAERKLARAFKNKGSNGIGSIRSGGGRIRDKFRSNVHKAALVSQLHLSHLRGKWPSGAAVTGSKHLGLEDNVDELGFNIRHTVGGAGEGYCNMNVISDKFEQDDLRSLDNDSFLHKLESAVYPGLLNNTSSQESQRAVTFAGIESSSDLIAADSYPQSDFRSLVNADLSLGAARSDVHRQRRVEHHRNGAFISLFPPVKHIRFPAPGPPVTGWAHLFSNLKDTTVKSTVAPEEPPQTVDVFHSSQQRDSSSHDDTKLPSVTATIFHPIPYTEPFRWQFGQEDLATTFPSSVLVPRRQSQNGPKTRQMSGPSSVGAKELPHINEHSSTSASKPTLASIVKSLQTRPLSPTAFDAHVDSGYHDSMLETSLDLSAQSLNSSLPPVNTPLSQPRFSDVIISQGYLLTPSHPLEGVCATPTQTVDTTCVHDFSNLEDTDYMAQDNLDLGTSCSSNGTGQDSGDSATVMLPNHLDINGRSSSKYLRPGFPLRSSNSSPTIGFSKL